MSEHDALCVSRTSLSPLNSGSRAGRLPPLARGHVQKDVSPFGVKVPASLSSGTTKGKRAGDQTTCDLVTQLSASILIYVHREAKTAKTLRSSTWLLIALGRKGKRTKHFWPCGSRRQSTRRIRSYRLKRLSVLQN